MFTTLGMASNLLFLVPLWAPFFVPCGPAVDLTTEHMRIRHFNLRRQDFSWVRCRLRLGRGCYYGCEETSDWRWLTDGVGEDQFWSPSGSRSLQGLSSWKTDTEVGTVLRRMRGCFRFGWPVEVLRSWKTNAGEEGRGEYESLEEETNHQQFERGPGCPSGANGS